MHALALTHAGVSVAINGLAFVLAVVPAAASLAALLN